MARVKFVLDWPGAREVFLAGDFNGWDPAARRMRRAPGRRDRFVTFLELPPGAYQFKYVVDGEWVCCPTLPRVPNEVGNDNSVIEVVPGRSRRQDRTR
jgi:1,4-alpha-glucan branching enzyme